jgi:hypothetical protein
MAYKRRCIKFNNEGDLQLDLILKGEEILVDGTFHLVVITEGLIHYRRQFQLSLVIGVPVKLSC